LLDTDPRWREGAFAQSLTPGSEALLNASLLGAANGDQAAAARWRDALGVNWRTGLETATPGDGLADLAPSIRRHLDITRLCAAGAPRAGAYEGPVELALAGAASAWMRARWRALLGVRLRIITTIDADHFAMLEPAPAKEIAAAAILSCTPNDDGKDIA
ncbi:MAG: hypothetical protein AAGJ87_04495, partial [Pseudomonadota bacterium]